MALGDSVPAGAGCGCTAYPELVRRDLAARTGRAVLLADRSVSGLTSPGLVRQVDGPVRDPLVRDVAAADVVLVEVGANDYAGVRDDVADGGCAGDFPCAAATDRTLAGALSTVLARVRQLRAGRPVRVVVVGYWNDFQDGEVGRELLGPAGVRRLRALTRHSNEVTRAAAERAGASYVDVYTPFLADDPTPLLAADGDHPSAAGHRLIARAVAAVVAAALGR
ncbi:MAG: SGNH/GDSL hydrolase family protein [Motilibacteraceae bacterium]